jgi:4-aminobutyrate aminotransferase-like enzyme
VGHCAVAERNVIKIRPPLVFKREHADLLLSSLDTVRSSL